MNIITENSLADKLRKLCQPLANAGLDSIDYTNAIETVLAVASQLERYEKALRFYEHVAALDGVDRSVATEALEEPK